MIKEWPKGKSAGVLLCVLAGLILTAGGCQSPGQVKRTKLCMSSDDITYTTKDGRITIKPRLKYELILSLHVLATAEDHHKLFIPWAQQMRKSLSPETLRDAGIVAKGAHEWQLCSLVADYDGPDTIECLTDYIEHQNKKTINRWAWWTRQSRSHPDFAVWYADFLRRYYKEGFEKAWLDEQKQLVYDDAKRVAGNLENLPFSITKFMEQHTGRRFSGSSKIILYPSSFSRPCHAYGFSENGEKVVLYQIGGEVIGDAFHELMHPLIHGWDNALRMKGPISRLGREPAFKHFQKKGSYSYPAGWVEEIFVHATANYLKYKAGLAGEEQIKQYQASYGPYESAVYDAIFDRYDRFDKIDDFIYYAMTHIHPNNDPGRPFIYVADK